MKKKSALGSFVSRTCGAASCANSASATRSPCQLRVSANVRRNCTDRRHRSGLTSETYIDADASCRMTMSALAFRTVDTSACGRASATMQSDRCQQHRGPEREIADGTEPFTHRAARVALAVASVRRGGGRTARSRPRTGPLESSAATGTAARQT